MSGTTDQPNEPTDNAEWARATDQRITSLENPTSQRIGEWVLSTSDNGNLIASHMNGGSTVLAKKPTEGEVDPDKIEDPVNSAVSVALVGSQSISGGGTGTPIIFDSVAAEVGGNWTGGLRTFASVMVPAAGVYALFGSAQFSADTARYGVAITVDDMPRLGGKTPQSGVTSVDCSSWAFGVLPLEAGQAIGLLAYCSASSSVRASTTPWSSPVPCTLSLALITRLD
jgi:hypothetical protein